MRRIGYLGAGSLQDSAARLAGFRECMAALRWVEGRYLDNGRISEKRRRAGLKPETNFRPGKR